MSSETDRHLRSWSPHWASDGAGIAIILLVMSYLILFGQIEWPGLHVDAPMYSTASVNLARGFGWHYGGYTDRLLWKPEGLYDHHGVLQAILYGKILKTTDWGRYHAANTLINILTYLFYTYLLHTCFQKVLRSACLPLSACAALVPTMIQLGVQGRPEHLLPPLIAIPYLAYARNQSAKQAYLVSLPISSLILLCSPVAGGMFLGLVCVLLLALLPLRKALFPIALLAGSCTLLSAAILAAATPYSLLGWLKTMSAASKVWVDTFPIEGILAAYKSNLLGGSFPAFAWNWSILFVIIVMVCSLLAFHRWSALALFAFLGFYLSDRTSDYNYAIFLPLAWLILCNLPLSHRLPPISYLSRRAHLTLIALITFVYLAWFGMYMLMSTATALSRTDASHARSVLEQQIARDPEFDGNSAIAYDFMQTPSFIVLGKPFESKGVHFVDSFSSSASSCSPGEMQQFEKIFKVKFRYYIQPLHFSILNSRGKAKEAPMPKRLCVGGTLFSLQDGPLNRNEARWGRLLPGRFKDFYSYALYKRLPQQAVTSAQP